MCIAYEAPSTESVGHHLRERQLSESLREQRWLLQEPLESSQIGMMFEQYRLAPPENILECSAGIIFCELARATDVISYWPLRMLDYVNRTDQGLEILNLEEQVPALNISLVYRNQELLTREARLLADELEYVFINPRAPKYNDDYC